MDKEDSDYTPPPHVEIVMSEISDIYKHLLSFGFTDECLLIPKTSDENDKKPVCFINFTNKNGAVTVEVGLIDDINLTEEEILTSLERAKEFMLTTLESFRTPHTIH